MPRPRTFVNDRGKPTKVNTGVSYHRASRRFYTLDGKSERSFFKMWDEARAVLAIAAVKQTGPAVSIEVPLGMWEGPNADELPPLGAPLDEINEINEINDDHPHKMWLIEKIKRIKMDGLRL